MKKVPSLIILAILAAQPPVAAAQSVAGSASRGTGAPAVVPALGVSASAPGASLTPNALTLSLALTVAPGAALAPSVVPAALTPAAVPVALKPVTGAAAAAERITAAQGALAAMPDMSKASAGQSHGAGSALEAALTGQRLAASAADVPFAGGANAELSPVVAEKAEVIKRIKAEIAKVIVGQEEMIDSIITAMVASEHVLLEGVPGVAKTQTVKAFSDAVKGDFQRVQGTPDKLPSDLLGAEILQEDPATGQKAIKLEKGPVFTNILLVDEINRMMPKTQAALLEAMAEGNATIGRNTLPLPKPFMVLATQNPIEQEGVYRLPEAQQDRFMYKVIVPRPTQDQLKTIMERFAKKDGQPRAGQITSLEEMVEIRKVAEQIHVDDSIMNYITSIVEATHNPGRYGIEAKDAIEGGASPRAAIFLLKAAKINALIDGRAYVSPRDVREVAARVLRHRLTLTYSAQNITTDQVVEAILAKVPVPKPQGKVEAALKPSDKK